MDTKAHSAASYDRLRAAEPFLIFAGVVLAIAGTIALVTWEAVYVQVGPQDPSTVTHPH